MVTRRMLKEKLLIVRYLYKPLLVKLYNWETLNFEYQSIINKLCLDWEKLIDENKNERYYHNFLSEHAGFFFSDWNSNLVISKLKMGSELECDLWL
jgi:hypothetical protein